jgi:hypothetical protein
MSRRRLWWNGSLAVDVGAGGKPNLELGATCSVAVGGKAI